MENEEAEAECCLSCKEYKPDKKIQCNSLAKILGNDRKKVTIDCPFTLRCRSWTKKIK